MDTVDITGKNYLPRLTDEPLKRGLSLMGAVVIEGPRACGKTMTGLNAAKSAVFLDSPELETDLQIQPSLLLEGESPRLLDEWQLAKPLWNLVRREVDFSQQPGRFILTGSAVPSDDITRHTGAGRFYRLRQYTMTWYERGLSASANDGGISLSDLFAGSRPSTGPRGVDYATLVEYLCCSGLPEYRDYGAVESLEVSRQYIGEAYRSDIERLAQIRQSPATLRALGRSLARNTASEANYATLRKDILPAAPTITVDSLTKYVNILQRIFLIDMQEAWVPDLRSKATLRTKPKWHFADASLAIAALRANQAALEKDPKTTGFLFESAVVHDLQALCQNLGGQVYHYRDSNGHEIDAVIDLGNGKWGAVEVKVSGNQILAGAKSLADACRQIDSEPVFRLVITAMGPTAILDDGTITCPLTALLP